MEQVRDTLPVSEQFGPTIQGEGPYAGRSVQFLRLGLCNLACSWCDTPYTWDATRFDLKVELKQTSVEDILERAIPGIPMVISGGEPLLHQGRPDWADLLIGLTDKGCEVHLETNGTILPNVATQRYATFASVSPKLPHAGVHRKGQKPAMHHSWGHLASHGTTALAGKSILKFVVETAADVDASLEYAKEHEWPLERVWVMPEGTSTEQLQAKWPEVAKRAAELHINATHRIHVLAWGDTKGT
ncbi:QueE-like radical SAM domain [Rhodococcus phage Finch]|uniref:QueE-like queosine biosynthesis protein n=1 Tax=Rhodococcus phage Finch TaxID=2094144 RepID=A0A2P1JXY9_9CAUD|nr:QueE-like radical SAM domain [Rhodococcus phage Finch]AVO25170.1 QueE-like queosine biosynthesis protein [Rhodococcus phage Finch]